MDLEALPVDIETTTGDHYVFPAMLVRTIRDRVEQGSFTAGPVSVLVNVHAATLLVPTETVRRVCVGGKEVWCRSPA